MEILAKKKEKESKQTLQLHTAWVIEEALKLIDDSSLDRVSKISGFNREEIRDLIFFSAYFHDIGKATNEFQNTIENGSKSYHPLYRASLLVEIEDFNFKTEFKAYGDITFEAKGNLVFFSGNGEKFILKNKQMDYINNFFQLNIDNELFENLKFNGTADDSVLTFNIEADNEEFHFIVEDGVFNRIQNMLSFRTTILENQYNLALIVYNSGYPLEISFQSDLGKERFQKFFTSSIKKRADKKFLQEILDLTLY